MADHTLFSNNFKECAYCKKTLPITYEGDVCPNCEERMLFSKVKEYIRSNIVNEYQVAEHFKIPLRQVRTWIKEGRIEYRTDDSTENIVSARCQKCGAPVTFGTLCKKCLKQLNSSKGFVAPVPKQTDTKMHYLSSEDENLI